MSSPTSKKPTFRHRGKTYPTVSSVVKLQAATLGPGGGGVKHPGLLDSALRKVVDTAGGDDAYPTFITKIAAVGHAIVQNHVFHDGNKRTAFQVMMLCLDLNRVEYQEPHPQAVSTVMLLLATGNLSLDALRVVLIHWCGLNPGDHTL